MDQLNDEYLVKTFHETMPVFYQQNQRLFLEQDLPDYWRELYRQQIYRPSPYDDLLRNKRNILDDWSKESDWAKKSEKAGEIVAKLLIALFYNTLSPSSIGRLANISDSSLKDAGVYLDSRGVQVLRPPEAGYIEEKTGRARLQIIGYKIPKFESLLTLIKSEIGGKFYRDHINHVLRVMLLSNYLISEIRRQIRTCGYEEGFYYFLTDEEEFQRKIWLPLILSSLYHDLAYPISETYETHEDLQTSLKKCYTVHDYLQNPEKILPIIDKYLSSISQSFFPILGQDEVSSKPSKRLKKEFKRAFLNHEHGILSAVDFLLLFEKATGDYEDLDELLFITAQAIALHNTLLIRKNNRLIKKNVGTIRFDEYPVAFLLILCDELQDWGRPIGKDVPPILDSIELDVSIDHNGRILIEASLDFSNACEGFSPFQQYKSKVESLRRLSIEPLTVEGPYLDITLHIPEFKQKKWHIGAGADEVDSEEIYRELPNMLVNEKTKEFYKMESKKRFGKAGLIDKIQYFDELRNVGLGIKTCGCGHIGNNAEIEPAKPRTYLFKKVVSPWGELYLRLIWDLGLEPAEKEQKWTRILSIKPDYYCLRCHRRYGDIELD